MAASPGTRDGSARAVEGARRFPGRRPCSATRPPGARSAPIRRRVRGQCGERRRRGGKSDPSRGRDTRAGDRDDRGGLRDCADGAGGRRGPIARRAAVRHAGEQYAWPRSHDGADREEAIAAPTDFLAKRRVHDVGAAARFDWTRRVKPWHKRDDWLGPSEHRGGHRGSGGISSRPSPRLATDAAYATARRRPTRRGRGR